MKDPVPAALAVAGEARRKLLRLARQVPRTRRAQLLASSQTALATFEPLIARVLRDAQLVFWLAAASEHLKGFSPPAKPATAVGAGSGPPPRKPPAFLPDRPDDPPPVIRFPQVEQAARDVAARLDYTPDDFAAIDAEARRVGFTVAKAQTLDAVRAVREAVARDVADGGTLKAFRRTVADALGSSALSPSQSEALYRTHTARAYSAGQIEVLDHEMVADEFPYLEYSATHDGRVRPEHLAMQSLGLDGTAVYRRDDPAWDQFYPPWGWNCRCVVIPLSVEDAAARGVKEARKWRNTGRPPTVPQYVKPLPFELPKGWTPTGRRLAAVI